MAFICQHFYICTISCYLYSPDVNLIQFKEYSVTVGCVIPMFIWSKFRMWQYRDDNHRENASNFTIYLFNSFLNLKCDSITGYFRQKMVSRKKLTKKDQKTGQTKKTKTLQKFFDFLKEQEFEKKIRKIKIWISKLILGHINPPFLSYVSRKQSESINWRKKESRSKIEKVRK